MRHESWFGKWRWTYERDKIKANWSPHLYMHVPEVCDIRAMSSGLTCLTVGSGSTRSRRPYASEKLGRGHSVTGTPSKDNVSDKDSLTGMSVLWTIIRHLEACKRWAKAGGELRGERRSTLNPARIAPVMLAHAVIMSVLPHQSGRYDVRWKRRAVLTGYRKNGDDPIFRVVDLGQFSVLLQCVHEGSACSVHGPGSFSPGNVPSSPFSFSIVKCKDWVIRRLFCMVIPEVRAYQNVTIQARRWAESIIGHARRAQTGEISRVP